MSEKPLEMILKTTVGEFELEYRISDISHIEHAYLSMFDVKRELRALKEKYHLMILADLSQSVARKYWAYTEKGPTISDFEDKSLSIMLSLLEVYPKTKMVKTIVEETGYSNSSVSDYLNGVTGGKGSCFEKDGKEWKLTTEGLFSISQFLKTTEKSDGQST